MGFDAARRSGSCYHAPIRACRADPDDDDKFEDDDELEELEGEDGDD